MSSCTLIPLQLLCSDQDHQGWTLLLILVCLLDTPRHSVVNVGPQTGVWTDTRWTKSRLSGVHIIPLWFGRRDEWERRINPVTSGPFRYHYLDSQHLSDGSLTTTITKSHLPSICNSTEFNFALPGTETPSVEYTQKLWFITEKSKHGLIQSSMSSNRKGEKPLMTEKEKVQPWHVILKR